MPFQHTKLYWLTQLDYKPHKQLMIAVFENQNDKIVKKYAFFPFFDIVLPEKISHSLLKQLFSSISGSRYRIRSDKKTTKVLARDFLQLKKLHSLVLGSLNIQPILLSPEKQFLCMQKWSYFDSFVFEFGDLLHVGLLEFPKLPGLERIQENDKQVLIQFAQSNLLLQPLSSELSTDEVLDRYFDLAQARYLLEEQPIVPSVQNTTGSVFEKFNLSSNTLNCACCKPKAADASNCLPSSLVEVTFLQDGFFYDSYYREFARQFHVQNPKKESRLKRKREFYLVNYPIGPFYRNQKTLLPITDALALQKTSEVIVNKTFQLSWACTNQTATAVLTQKALQNKQTALKKFRNETLTLNLQNQGLLAYLKQNQTLTQAFHNRYQSLLSSYLEALPSYLSNPSTPHTNPGLTREIRFLSNLA